MAVVQVQADLLVLLISALHPHDLHVPHPSVVHPLASQVLVHCRQDGQNASGQQVQGLGPVWPAWCHSDCVKSRAVSCVACRVSQ